MIIFDGIVFSLQKFGGISTYFNHLIKGVSECTDDVECRTYSKCHLDISSQKVYKKYRSRFLERYRNVSNVTDTSILHSSYYRIAGNKKAKNVITVYDFTYEKFGSYPSKFVHAIQKSNAITRADLILCISESTKRDLLEYHPQINDKKVFVTHLAASDMFFSKKIAYDVKMKDPYVLFVGARAGYKNFKSVVIALSKLPGMQLKFVGGGNLSDNESEFLNKWLFGRFEHVGGVNTEKLNDLYNHAICLVYPSNYEGFGIPILEAMSAGCPVIATNTSSIPEVAGNSAMLLELADPDAIRDAIYQISEKDIHEKIVMNGFENAKKFTWKKTVDNTLEMYGKIA